MNSYQRLRALLDPDLPRFARAQTKVCNGCGVEKEISRFYRYASGRPYHRCKPCISIYNKMQTQKHAAKRKEYDHARGSGWDRSGRAKWSITELDKHDAYLRRRYGITIAQYDTILAGQNGVCAICAGECNRSTSKRLCVDHDHSTGVVRGLLCFQCNVGLGKFKDDPLLLMSAKRYLEQRRMKVYLAGGMRGIPEFNFPAFHAAAARLREQGHTVFNPAEKDNERHGVDISAGNKHGDEELAAKQHGFNLREALGLDLQFICAEADAVALLPGWERSKGAIAERATAIALGLELILL